MFDELVSRWLPFALLASLLLSCHKAAPSPSLDLKSDEDRTFYALGLDIGRNIEVFSLQPPELERVAQGLRDAVTKSKPLVDLESARPQLIEMARQRQQAKADSEKQRGREAIEKAAREPGAEQLASGVVIKSLRPGSGPSPTENDIVSVQYEGRLLDGTVFDSSYKRNQPSELSLRGVIRCWVEGLAKMTVGEKTQLTCPPDVAYGDQGRPPTIPRDATLIFDIELLAIGPKK